MLLGISHEKQFLGNHRFVVLNEVMFRGSLDDSMLFSATWHIYLRPSETLKTMLRAHSSRILVIEFHRNSLKISVCGVE